MKIKYEKEVSVIGGGSWGTTLAHLLAINGYKPYLWVRTKERVTEINKEHKNSKYLPEFQLHPDIKATNDLEKVVQSSKTIIIAIPSKYFRNIITLIGKYIKPDQLVVHGTKGIELHTFKRMSEILIEETCCRKIGVISGPNLSKEIMSMQPTATVIASKFDEVIFTIQKYLASTILRVYGSYDVVGVEFAGALKNIIAIASGFINGMGYGDNTKATVLTRGVAEITRFGVYFGADPRTFGGLAGIGDLIATCSSHLSRNFQVGYRLSKGESLQDIEKTMYMVAEGVNTTKAVYQIASKYNIDMPITAGIYKVLYEQADPKQIAKSLMLRKSRFEIDQDFVWQKIK